MPFTRQGGLHEINEMKRKMKSKSLARLFCCVHAGDDNYVYSMENLERIHRTYLEKVHHIVSDKQMPHKVYSDYRNETVKTLHDAAVIRKEEEWAEYFLRPREN